MISFVLKVLFLIVFQNLHCKHTLSYSIKKKLATFNKLFVKITCIKSIILIITTVGNFNT